MPACLPSPDDDRRSPAKMTNRKSKLANRADASESRKGSKKVPGMPIRLPMTQSKRSDTAKDSAMPRLAHWYPLASITRWTSRRTALSAVRPMRKKITEVASNINLTLQPTCMDARNVCSYSKCNFRNAYSLKRAQPTSRLETTTPVDKARSLRCGVSLN